MKKIKFILISFVPFAVIAAVAFAIGIQSADSTSEFMKVYRLNRIFFIEGELNQYAITSPIYVSVIFLYWYTVSAVLTFLGSKVIKIFRKGKDGKKGKNKS